MPQTAQHMPKHPKPMPPAEAIEQLALYRSTGDVRYRNNVVTGNVAMLIKLVNNDKYKFPNIDIQDLLQEAQIGFTKGLENYANERATTEHGTAKPANYARHYARGAVIAFIQQHGHNIPIPDKCHRAYKVMMGRMDAAVQEHQTENLSPRSFIEDQQGYKQDGAMALANRRFVDPNDAEHETYYNHGPSRTDLNSAMAHLANLPEPQLSVMRAQFGFGDESLEEMMVRCHLEIEDVTRIVQGCIQRIRKSMSHDDIYMPPNPRERRHFPSKQACLFTERDTTGPGGQSCP